MSREGLQHKPQTWYTPFGVLALNAVLPVAAGVALLIAGIELLRNDPLQAGLTLALAVGFGLARLTLPQVMAGSGQLNLARALLIGTAVLALYSTALTQLSAYTLWARLWVLIPALFGAIILFRPQLAAWATREISDDEVEAGLLRSRRLWPLLQKVSSHIFLLHACMLIILPILWIADVALSPGNLLGGGFGDAFTLEHFAKMMGGSEFWIWTRNSLIVAIGTTLFGLALAVPAAYAFSRFDFTGRQPAMFGFILVQMFPGAIILVPYFLVMKTLGLLNTSIGLIIAYSVTALPLCIWMLKGFFDAIPRELEEAAKLDGCSTLQIFIRIILPLSIPAVAVTGVFCFLAAWNEFLLALVFNTSNDQFTLPVGLSSLIPANNQRWGDFAAASLLVSLPVVALFIAFQKSLIQGLSSGAVKG